jgi:hypothetical protein
MFNTNQLIHISSELLVLLSTVYFLNKQIKTLRQNVVEVKEQMKKMELTYEDKLEHLFRLVNNHHMQLNRLQMRQYSEMEEQYNEVPSTYQQGGGIRRRKVQIREEVDSNEDDIQEEKQKSKQVPVMKLKGMNQTQKVNEKQTQNPLLNVFSNLNTNPFDIINEIASNTIPITMSFTSVENQNGHMKKSQAQVEIIDDEPESNDELDETKLDEDLKDDLEDLLKDK